MFLQYLQTDPRFYMAVIIVVVISICLHELAHGFAAIALGDRTPEETGHITLNPFVHMGPVSLVMLAVVGISWGMMPVDPSRLRGRYAESLVAAAGPFTNLLLAVLGALGLGLWYRFGTVDTEANHMVDNAVLLLRMLSIYNFLLFALNLIPVPPLDGSRIAANLFYGYGRLLSDPTMSGFFLAVTIGVLLAAGRYLFPWALDTSDNLVHWIATVGRAAATGGGSIDV